ncbi:MAG: DNA-binding transcriptional LysR family regulator [Ilumatobacter sp.]|jgi:DNA-binding transcriptional LysR family regulator
MGTPGLQLDVESLRTLLAVLDHGGMTRAAEHLHLSQSAVSWKIKRLEERVGRPLLIRDGRTLRPTRDCRALLVDARAMVEIHDRVASRLESSELTGTVRLGSNEEVDPARMARLLGRFKIAHPGATIEFVIDHTEHLAAQIDSGELDVAIVQVIEEKVRPTDTVLWTDRLMWMTSAERRHENEEILPLITFGEHCFYRSVSEPSLDEAGIGHNIVFSASSISGVAQRLRRGSASALSAHVTSTTTTSSRCRGHDPFPTCQ